MRIVADLHLHSRYSRATSPEMDARGLAHWARLKGITVVGTGDFTHPSYFAELRANMEPAEPGLLRLKAGERDVRFMLTVEVSNIYSQGGRLRKIHTLIAVPSFEVAEALNTRLASFGKLHADGRPIFGFPARDLVKLVLDLAPESVLIPAHVWTPWFSLFGSFSGFDSLEECFGDEARHIFTLETGLSSDPPMNWRLSALDGRALVSNSDAHSPAKLGREANVLDCGLDYHEIWEAVRARDPKRFLYTIEFFPEEGKYHYNGHRTCRVLQAPEETKRMGNRCPVCGRGLTLGVLHRVDELADRPAGHQPPGAIPCRYLVPLQEIVAEALGQGVNTRGVEAEYLRLVREAGDEFRLLLDLPLEEMARFAPPRVVEGIGRVREGNLTIIPGYDGVYGVVSLFGEKRPVLEDELAAQQMSLF